MHTSRKNRWALGIGTLLLAALGTPSAMANVTYTYTGNAFNVFIDTEYVGANVSGYFVLPSAPISQALGVVIPLAFYFAAGPTNLNNSTPLVQTIFQIQTDGTGNITEWAISLESNGGNDPQINIVTFNQPPVLVSDSGYRTDGVGAIIQSGQINGNAGLWLLTEGDPTPEPTSFSLAALGLLGIALAQRKRLSSRC